MIYVFSQPVIRYTSYLQIIPAVIDTSGSSPGRESFKYETMTRDQLKASNTLSQQDHLKDGAE